jgi:hypothetical protein
MDLPATVPLTIQVGGHKVVIGEATVDESGNGEALVTTNICGFPAGAKIRFGTDLSLTDVEFSDQVVA